MRLLYLTAGAGGMYCGTCIRDNALAAALMARGHDVTLVPMYTPPRTDEADVSQHRVFFGGISVYLEQYHALFRRTPWILDRLWEAPWLLRAVAGRGIATEPERLGDLTISMLQGRDGRQRKELDKLLYWLRDQPRPDVVDISNSLLIGLARPVKEALACPVCCTLQGESVFLNGLREPYRARALELIRAAAPSVDRFLAVSDYYAGHMSRALGIPGAKIDVVPLGVSMTGIPERIEPPADRFVVGYFGRVAPEKGLHVLCDVYRRLVATGAGARYQLRIAGYLGPEHRTYLESVLQRVREWGLEDSVQYAGELDRSQKFEFLNSLSVLVVAATYDDPKGLALLEAMACGVPVVATRRGTYTELVERTGGGLLVPPDDVEAIRSALQRLRDDSSFGRELGRRGAASVRERYTSAHMADRALDVYGRLMGPRAPVAM